MNPITFEQTIAIVSFVGVIVAMVSNIHGTTKSAKDSAKKDAERLVRIEEGVRRIGDSQEEAKTSLANYMGRTDGVLSDLKKVVDKQDRRLIKVEETTKDTRERLVKLENAHENNHH